MLKPCKLCGGMGRSYTFYDDFFEKSCRIKCQKCGKSTATKYSFYASDARAEAEKDWDKGLIN